MVRRRRLELHYKKTTTTESVSMVKEDLLVAIGCRLPIVRVVVWATMAVLWIIGAGDAVGLWELGPKSPLG